MKNLFSILKETARWIIEAVSSIHTSHWYWLPAALVLAVACLLASACHLKTVGITKTTKNMLEKRFSHIGFYWLIFRRLAFILSGTHMDRWQVKECHVLYKQQLFIFKYEHGLNLQTSFSGWRLLWSSQVISQDNLHLNIVELLLCSHRQLSHVTWASI